MRIKTYEDFFSEVKPGDILEFGMMEYQWRRIVLKINRPRIEFLNLIDNSFEEFELGEQYLKIFKVQKLI